MTINKKIFLLLLGLSLASIACVFPYIATVQAEILTKAGQPLSIIFLDQLIQSLILFSFCISVGLAAARKTGFHLPLFTAWLEKGNWRQIIKDNWTVSLLSGLAVAIAIYAVDELFTIQGVQISTHATYAPAWQTLLAAAYGGITEEIIMRLFLMSSLIWLGMRIMRQPAPAASLVILAILVSAIIFGLGHLPITASITALSTAVIVRAVVLNGIGGIVFGWLYWRKGLEAAIISHFTADIFLLTLLPLIF